MGKEGIDPELRAQWLEARRQLAESLERGERRYVEWLAAEERRKVRLRRLTFGLLGR